MLSFFLRSLHLSGEFLQVSQQTLVGEMERLHLISIGLYSFESVSASLAGLASQGVSVTPAHVSGRYHQSLRIQFYL